MGYAQKSCIRARRKSGQGVGSTGLKSKEWWRRSDISRTESRRQRSGDTAPEGTKGEEGTEEGGHVVGAVLAPPSPRRALAARSAKSTGINPATEGAGRRIVGAPCNLSRPAASEQADGRRPPRSRPTNVKRAKWFGPRWPSAMLRGRGPETHGGAFAGRWKTEVGILCFDSKE